MIRLWPEMQWEDFLSETNPSGIVVDTLGRGIPMAQGEAALLLRVTYAPGSHLPPHTDPGTGVWVVERGMIGFGVQEGEAVITRASGGSRERVGAGVEVILESGDTASYGPDNFTPLEIQGRSKPKFSSAVPILTLCRRFTPLLVRDVRGGSWRWPGGQSREISRAAPSETMSRRPSPLPPGKPSRR